MKTGTRAYNREEVKGTPKIRLEALLGFQASAKNTDAGTTGKTKRVIDW